MLTEEEYSAFVNDNEDEIDDIRDEIEKYLLGYLDEEEVDTIFATGSIDYLIVEGPVSFRASLIKARDWETSHYNTEFLASLKDLPILTDITPMIDIIVGSNIQLLWSTESIDKKKKKKKQVQEKQKKELLRRMKKKQPIKKQRKRTKNTTCINDKDYVTLEDVEDIPIEDIIKFHVNKKIHCLDKGTLTELLKEKNIKYNFEYEDEYYLLPLSFTIWLGKNDRNLILEGIKKSIFSFELKHLKDSYYIAKVIKVKVKTPILKIRKHKGKNKKNKGYIYKMPTVVELKQMCRDKGIKGYSKMKKAELLIHCKSLFSNKYIEQNRTPKKKGHTLRQNEFLRNVRKVVNKAYKHKDKTYDNISHLMTYMPQPFDIDNDTRRKANKYLLSKPLVGNLHKVMMYAITDRIDTRHMNKATLKRSAKLAGLKGYSKMNKAELISLLRKN